MSQHFSFYLSILALSLLVNSCTSPSSTHPLPTEVYENEESGEQEGGYKAFYEYSREAALGRDWKQITFENFETAKAKKRSQLRGSFAGGALQGTWAERGSSNVTGNTKAVYYAPSEEIYAMSASGTLFRGSISGSGWTLLNENENFNDNAFAVVSNGGSKRIVAAKDNQLVYYSDNEGLTFTQASGIANPFNWGDPDKMIVLNNGIMYYLQYTWMNSPWGSGYKLNRSSDNGATWTTVQTFGSRSSKRVSMWSPFESNELYVLDNGATLYSLSGTASTLSVLNVCSGLPTGTSCSFSGYQNGATLNLYALSNGSNLYVSTNSGLNWTSVSTLSTAAWSVGLHANPWVTNALYYGAVNFWKSADGGGTFTEQNIWWQYYSNTHLLHADMVSVVPGKKNDGTKFLLIGCHGGIYYFPAPFSATTNLTLSGVHDAEYYDVVTIGGQIFAGAQDQGSQRFSSGSGVMAATQLISGDYVRLNTSVNGTKYWQEYPGGAMHYYNNPLTSTGYNASIDIHGDDRVNMQQWVVPTCNWAIPSENSILIGGGSTTTGNTTDSKLIKLTSTGSAITASEYSFNFLANGGSYITAVDHSPADPNYMYVGLANGKFYYSQNAGTSWTQTVGFTGPSGGWNYGSYIHCSRLNKNLVFYCGGGGVVYKSTDGGVTFTSMPSGFPNTFTSELTLNTGETVLFAATDAGPYACILSTGQWYSLLEAATPNKSYTSVEYIASSNIARFSAWGRGVWDFQVTAAPLPVTYTSFEGTLNAQRQVALEWETASENNSAYFEVERSSDGSLFVPIHKERAKNTPSSYACLDKNPLQGINYYSLKQVDQSGDVSYSAIISVQAQRSNTHVFPSILTASTPIHIQTEVENSVLSVYDASGRLVLQNELSQSNSQVTLSSLRQGVYFYSLKNKEQGVLKTGKLVME
jgi:hypothetical protein